MSLGFSRIYKNVEHSWKNWILEFEAIICKMKWDSVNVILETEMFGTHQYMWLNKHHPNGKKKRRILMSYLKKKNGISEKASEIFGETQ